MRLLLARELRLTRILFAKELRELLVSRALWAMVLLSAPLVGFSFIQAVRTYSDSSASALKLPQLAANQNPLDGIVIPVFSAVYLMNTFLFPFVAIRAIGNDKQTGALKLALQLPVGVYRLVAVKLAALMVGWSLALIPTVSALMIWSMLLGGHLDTPELMSVLLGHTLYALVIAGVAFLAATLTESAATAAIVALAFTLAAWILEFAGQVGTGLVRAVSSFSLTPALRGLEQGLVGSPTAIALAVLALGFLALTVVWLPPGVTRREKLLRSGAVAGVAFQALLLAVQLPIYADVTEDHRNSFNPADVRALSRMTRELKIDVNLATNDSRFADLQRNVLAKLQRTAPHVSITYSETSTSGLLGGTNYGLVTYTYAGKQATSRATTAREVLPLIEALDGLTVTPDPVSAYPGYPLTTSGEGATIWFYGVLPLLGLGGWWYFQQPPSLGRNQHTRRRLYRVPIAVGLCLVGAQFVPYGRGHTNLVASPPRTLQSAASEWCSSSSPTTTLGAFRQQVGALQLAADAALNHLRANNPGGLLTQYAQLTVGYAAASRELAKLYPVQCQRLLDTRVVADAAISTQKIDGGSAGLTLVALRAGFAAIGADLDQRITQASPNGLITSQTQAPPPAISGTPPWDSPQTQELAMRACGACHSNTPGWSWYTNIAPVSFAIQHNVDAGRAALNFSEFDMPQPNAIYAARSVQDGSMPPRWASLLDSRLHLSDAERATLVRDLQSTFSLSRR